jgi:hypothetical protein
MFTFWRLTVPVVEDVVLLLRGGVDLRHRSGRVGVADHAEHGGEEEQRATEDLLERGQPASNT